MDGVLIDSEPLWREAEIVVLGSHGVPLTETMCLETMGLRLDEVVDHWYCRYPWPRSDDAAVATRVVERITELIACSDQPLPRDAEAVAASRVHGFRTALASSSPMALIEALLQR